MLTLEQIRGRRLAELKILIDNAKARSLNLKPVFYDFSKEYYKRVEQNWEMRGTMFGLKWAPLSPKYAKYKKLKVGNAQANLILTGRLKLAATGKSNEGFVKISKLKLEMGIKGIPYTRVHQWGYRGQNIPQRPYWLMKDGSIHPRLERFFRERLIKHINLEGK